MDLRQLILLAIAVAVPLGLFALNRQRLVLGWVCLTLSVHIFDTTIITNLPAARIVGLLYLPYALLIARSWLRLVPAQLWLLGFLYLAALGLVFGFLWPWPDTSGNRPLTMTAPGRAIVYLSRLLADLSLTIFVARELRKPGALLFLGRAFVLGAVISALAGIVNLLRPGFDPYFAITGLRYLNGIQFFRSRGLSFEPRGLGMACVYSLMILIIAPGRITLRRQALIVISLLGILVSYSTSSLALFAAGIVTAWIFISNRTRLLLLGVLLTAVLFAGIGSIMVPQYAAMAVQTVRHRIDPSERLGGAEPETWGQAIAYRLDSFDGSALLFLLDQPEYIVIGTGPGMMLLPASDYVPPGIYSLMYPKEKGLDGLPTHGPLLELSNGGLLGLTLWLAQIAYCWSVLRALKRQAADRQQQREWRFGEALFVIGVVFYTLQTSITSPIWAVILGVGWAAAMLLDQRRRDAVIGMSRQSGQLESTPLALSL
jgi:hypothetical protein